MSGTMTVAAPPAAERTRTGQSWAAVFALARFEARRLLLSIPVIVGFLVYLAWIVWRALNEVGYPALQDVDRATQGGPLFVGLAVLLTVNQAVLRSRRRDTERHFGVQVVGTGRRTVAHVLSVLPAIVLTAFCVGGQFAWEALKSGAIGSGSVGELLVGPLTVLLFGAAGVLLARLVASAFAAPLLIVVFLFLFVLGTGVGSDAGWTRWLSPVVGEMSRNTLPSELIGRPAAWHALYLLGLGLSVALLAVLVGGGLRTRAVQVSFAGALALTVLGAVAQGLGVSPETTAARERATTHPEQVQICVERDGSRYCAFPEWRSRTADWAQVVNDVRALAGGTAHDQRLVVRQRIDATYGLDADAAIEPSGTAHQVTVGTSWGGNRVPEFSTAVAGVLVAGDEKAAGELCDGRMVTLMWLALAWDSDPIAQLRNVRIDDSLTGPATVLSPTNPLSMTEGQTTVVRELLAQPRSEIAPKIKQHWTELTSPRTTTAHAAEVLGVDTKVQADKCD